MNGTDRADMGRGERPGLGPADASGPDRARQARAPAMGRKSKDARRTTCRISAAWRKQADGDRLAT